MDQDIIKHDNAISSWITLCIDRDRATTTLLMIETDLSLNAEDPNYRKDAVDSLVGAAVAYVGHHPHIDTIEIEQIRQGSLDVTSMGD
jgi:predicted RNA-binding protein with EMAP domain